MNITKLAQFSRASQIMREALRLTPGWDGLTTLDKEMIEVLQRKIIGLLVNPDDIPEREIWAEIEDIGAIMSTELNRQEYTHENRDSL